MSAQMTIKSDLLSLVIEPYFVHRKHGCKNNPTTLPFNSKACDYKHNCSDGSYPLKKGQHFAHR